MTRLFLLRLLLLAGHMDRITGDGRVVWPPGRDDVIGRFRWSGRFDERNLRNQRPALWRNRLQGQQKQQTADSHSAGQQKSFVHTQICCLLPLFLALTEIVFFFLFPLLVVTMTRTLYADALLLPHSVQSRTALNRSGQWRRLLCVLRRVVPA